MAPITPAGTQPQTTRKPSRWWELVIYAAFCFGVAGYYLSEITTLEISGGTIKIPLLLMLPYKIGGKWGLVGILGAIGTYSFALGVVRAFSARSSPPRPVPFEQQDPVWARRMGEDTSRARTPGTASRKR
jgi:hypothetical protein